MFNLPAEVDARFYELLFHYMSELVSSMACADSTADESKVYHEKMKEVVSLENNPGEQ